MSVLLFEITFIVVCATSIVAIDEYRTVETFSGRIRGVKKSSLLKNVEYYSFKGIPYGKSPTGELRFKVVFISYFACMLDVINF